MLTVACKTAHIRPMGEGEEGGSKGGGGQGDEGGGGAQGGEGGLILPVAHSVSAPAAQL